MPVKPKLGDGATDFRPTYRLDERSETGQDSIPRPFRQHWLSSHGDRNDRFEPLRSTRRLSWPGALILNDLKAAKDITSGSQTMPVDAATRWLGSWFRKPAYILSGVRVPVDKSIMSDETINKIARGKYEKKEADLVKQIIREDDIVLEIGGGIGFISTVAARLATKGKITSVEANPRLIPYISNVHAINSVRVEVLNAIVTGQKTGDDLPFYLRKNFWSSSMLSEPADWTEIVTVKCLFIADLVARVKPTVLIVDIEGAEIELIESNWTSGIRAAIVEVHPRVIGTMGVKKIVDFFKGSGYQVSFESKSKNMLIAQLN
jgi:FkbM family methyltransferase